MKSIKRRRINGVLVSRNIHFAVRSRLALWLWVKKSRGSLRRGQSFRAGYQIWRDGLDCVWLVNDAGKYLHTIDHDFLQKHFEVESKCQERSVYRPNRAKLLPIPQCVS
jgi:hypothetical protein